VSNVAGPDGFSTGYEPAGLVRPDSRESLLELLRDAVLCNDADLQPPDADHPGWRPVGDPTEAALVVPRPKPRPRGTRAGSGAGPRGGGPAWRHSVTGCWRWPTVWSTG
jgi:hypothetical protein